MIVLQICYNYCVIHGLTFATYDDRLILKNINQFKKKKFSCIHIII